MVTMLNIAITIVLPMVMAIKNRPEVAYGMAI
nr:MAG TPA: hypothetical protein [Caudoviricetes sp.]